MGIPAKLNSIPKGSRTPFQADLKVNCRIVELEPHALLEIWSDIDLVAAACDWESTGAALVRRLRSRMTEISSVAPGTSHRRRLASIEWLELLIDVRR